MKKIQDMIADVIKKEGGYVNHPADKGGPTKYGITLTTLEAWRKADLEAHDVELLSRSEAAEIYEQNYYIAPGINKLPENIQPLVFDMAVNHGAKRAAKLLQSELLAIGYYSFGKVDGVIGPNTIKAAQRAIVIHGDGLIDKLVDRRIGFYKAIIEEDPIQAEFENGWIARAESFRTKTVA